MNLAFVLTIRDEPADNVGRCIAFLRRAYPAEPVVVISDGVPLARRGEIAQAFGCIAEQGLHLKRGVMGGAWWERTFEAGLRDPATTHLVKIDPDTIVWRPLKIESEFDVAGTVVPAVVGISPEHVQGGFQVIRRSFAERALAADPRDWPELRDPRCWGYPPRVDWFVKSGYLSSDATLMLILRRLGGSWGSHPEIHSWYPPDDIKEYNRWAVTHPHKSKLSW